MEVDSQMQQVSQTYIYDTDCFESLLIKKKKFSETQIIYNPFLAKLSLALDPIKLDDCEHSFEEEEEDEANDSFINDSQQQNNVCKRSFLKESKFILTKMSDFILN